MAYFVPIKKVQFLNFIEQVSGGRHDTLRVGSDKVAIACQLRFRALIPNFPCHFSLALSHICAVKQ